MERFYRVKLDKITHVVEYVEAPNKPTAISIAMGRHPVIDCDEIQLSDIQRWAPS